MAAAARAHGAAVKARKSAIDADPASHDTIRIKLSGSSKAVPELLQELEQVAARNKLTQDEPSSLGNVLRVVLRRSGFETHEIEVETATARETEEGGAARLAIILDDFGADSSAANAVFGMHYPLTLSILPGKAHSLAIAEEAHRRGYEVMLHLPMESIGKEQREAQELRPGMSTAQVSSMVNNFLTRVPYAKGVNNHQGSQATSDARLMSELMPLLRDKGLFYIDSRTTAATVAYDAAQQDGVASAFRSVPFLDDVEQVVAIRKQLELAFRGAKEKGEAVAIGHPHAATLEALRESLPRAKAEGIQLVVASELVH